MSFNGGTGKIEIKLDDRTEVDNSPSVTVSYQVVLGQGDNVLKSVTRSFTLTYDEDKCENPVFSDEKIDVLVTSVLGPIVEVEVPKIMINESSDPNICGEVTYTLVGKDTGAFLTYDENELNRRLIVQSFSPVDEGNYFQHASIEVRLTDYESALVHVLPIGIIIYSCEVQELTISTEANSNYEENTEYSISTGPYNVTVPLITQKPNCRYPVKRFIFEDTESVSTFTPEWLKGYDPDEDTNLILSNSYSINSNDGALNEKNYKFTI